MTNPNQCIDSTGLPDRKERAGVDSDRKRNTREKG